MLRVHPFIAFVGSLGELVVGPGNAKHVAPADWVANPFRFRANFSGALSPVAGIAEVGH